MAKPLSKADLGKFDALHNTGQRLDISAPKAPAPAPAPANNFKPAAPGQKAGL